MNINLFRINFLSIIRDPVVLAMLFVLPIVFFSIFALIYGGFSQDESHYVSQIKVAIIDYDQSILSTRLLESLKREKPFKILSLNPHHPEPTELVRSGDATVLVSIPHGWYQSLSNVGQQTHSLSLFFDSSDPGSKYIVSSILQKMIITLSPDIFTKNFLSILEKQGIKFDSSLNSSVNDLFYNGNNASSSPSYIPPIQEHIDISTYLPIDMFDVRDKKNTMLSYSAAGIAVMFLLFTMAGAAGSILNEVEGGTLERLLNSNITMASLLISKWLYFSLMGFVEVFLMFVWGALVFGLDLWSSKHLIGFFVMTLFVSLAASAFGIIFASLCKTRAQLSGISTIVILIMSAVGGSMVPRQSLPDIFDKLSLFTFNGWALDGYLKIFWYDDPQMSLFSSLFSLWPQILSLSVMTSFFLIISFFLSRRWESV